MIQPMTPSKILLYLCLLFIGGVFIYSFFIVSKNEENSQYYDQKVTLKGIIIKEPEQRINQQKFQFKTDEITGKILISTELYPEYYYGDELEITGKLLEPAVFEDFDYQQYLAKDKIYLVSYYPQIKLIDQNQGSWFYQRIFNFKDKLRNVIEQTLLPPQSSILKAVFLGDKFGLSDELKEKLNISGTRHIVAISGMHIPITP